MIYESIVRMTLWAVSLQPHLFKDTMKTLATLCCFLCVLACLPQAAFSTQTEKTAEQAVSLPAPDGYSEILANDWPLYAASVGAENAYMLNRLSGVFLKTSELPAFRAGDFNELSASFVYGLFQVAPATYASLFASVKGEPLAHTKAMQKKAHDFVSSLYAEQFYDMERVFTKSPPARSGNVLDLPGIASWLLQHEKGASKPLALGSFTIQEGSILYAWVQPDTDCIGFGLTAPAPIVVIFALIDVNGRTAYAAHARRLISAQDAEAALRDMTAYLEKNISRITFEEKSPLPPVENSFNVLSYAAQLWFSQEKYDAACSAFERLGNVRKAKGIFQNSLYSDAAMLALAHMLAGRPAKAIEITQEYLRSAEKSFPPHHMYILNLKTVQAQSCYALAKYDNAFALYGESIDVSRKDQDFPTADHMNMMREYASLLIEQKQLDTARALLQEAFLLSLQHAGLEEAVSCSYALVQLAIHEKRPLTAIFYNKLAAGIVCYAEQNSQVHMQIDEGTNASIKQLLQAVLQKTGMITTGTGFYSLWNTPNTVSDTPWNKGRLWMTGAEIALYEQYGDVVTALKDVKNPATAGDVEQRFANWMADVKKALD